MGPGIITANVDNDAGGIATYSMAGAHFGYAMLWTLIPITIALIVIQEMGTRMGVVTNKGLSDLIRESFGVKITFFLMIGLLLTNLGNTIAEFSGVAASGEIFGISKYIAIPVSAVFVWLLVVKGTYKIVEKIFLFACVFYGAYIISCFLAKPDWNEVLINTVKPTFKFEKNYLIMLIGVVGTSIAPWMQFYIQSSIVEKGVKIEEYKYSRLDVIVGCFIMVIVASSIIIACAATLYKHGIKVETAADAAIALRPFAGKYCAQLFAFGLLNASLFSASILPLSTSYYICEAMGWECGVGKTFKTAAVFYGLYTVLIIMGAGLVLIPKFPLLLVMLFSQVINGIMLPFVLIFMLLLINNKRLMGNYVNSKSFNIIAWITTVAMIILTLMLVVNTLI